MNLEVPVNVSGDTFFRLGKKADQKPYVPYVYGRRHLSDRSLVRDKGVLHFTCEYDVL